MAAAFRYPPIPGWSRPAAEDAQRLVILPGGCAGVRCKRTMHRKTIMMCAAVRGHDHRIACRGVEPTLEDDMCRCACSGSPVHPFQPRPGSLGAAGARTPRSPDVEPILP